MNSKKNLKKIFVILLMLVMILQMVPVSAFAVSAAETAGTDSVIEKENGIVYVKYSDISQYRTKDEGKDHYTAYPQKEGYVFGGWFQSADEINAVAADTVNGEAWAKFVPEETLSLKRQITKKMADNPSSVKMRLVTSLDSVKYNEIGFVMTSGGKTKEIVLQNVGRQITVTDPENGTSMTDPKTEFCDASNYFATIKITGFEKDDFESWEIDATPYWITKDGTKVLGIGRTRMLVSDERMNDEDGSQAGETEDFTKSETALYTYNNSDKSENRASFRYFKGGSDTVYLKGIYTTAGSADNHFGITIRNGGQTRQVYFDGVGIKVLSGTATTASLIDSGLADSTKAADVYNTVTNEDGVFIWSQRNGSDSTKNKSAVAGILDDTDPAEHEVIWAIEQNVLYCSVDSQVVLRLPMEKLCADWKQGRCYQLGVAAYNSESVTNNLKFSVDKLAFGKEAVALLCPETFSETEKGESANIGYEPITGSYMPATAAGKAYLYGQAAENCGISADITWVEMANTASAAGVTVKVGDKSAQYLVQGNNVQVRHQSNHGWSPATQIQAQVTKLAAKPFNADGNSHVDAFVKDGYFYIQYNGVQAVCVNMRSLFNNYTAGTTAKVGISSWDANNGLAQFQNITFLSGDQVKNIASEEWNCYSESTTNVAGIDFAKGSFQKATINKVAVMNLLGQSTTWQVEGTMKRASVSTAVDLLMGFRISTSDGKYVRILGKDSGFARLKDGKWSGTSPDWKWTDYANASKDYVFQTLGSDFFKKQETASELDFKAVIYEDVFYVWFKDSNGEYQLCWRIPLTDTNIYGFAADSSYQLSLDIADAKCDGGMTGLDIKMGYQVTGQEGFNEMMEAAKAMTKAVTE